MDIATVIGLVTCIGAILGSIIVGAPLSIFIDTPSMLVVGLGVIGVTLMKWPMEKVTTVAGFTMKAFFFSTTNSKELIDRIYQLADIARRESVFALEKEQIDDPFLAKAMKLAADNRPPEVISSILGLEIESMEERHRFGVDMWSNVADDGPAMGMIGTLIGLVIMLQNLSDPSAIGPAMAVALLTTFYGACLANVIAGPFKTKLSFRSAEEITALNIIISGTLGIVAGENPRLIKDKLMSFLPPDQREQEEAGGGE